MAVRLPPPRFQRGGEYESFMPLKKCLERDAFIDRLFERKLGIFPRPPSSTTACRKDEKDTRLLSVRPRSTRHTPELPCQIATPVSLPPQEINDESEV
jgi:hypothetical protein